MYLKLGQFSSLCGKSVIFSRSFRLNISAKKLFDRLAKVTLLLQLFTKDSRQVEKDYYCDTQLVKNFQLKKL